MKLSGLFSFFFQPVKMVVNTSLSLVNTVTTGIDTTFDAISSAFKPIPLVGAVMEEASQQVNIATNVVDTAVGYVSTTVANAGYMGSHSLDLNLGSLADDIKFQLDTALNEDQLLDNTLNEVSAVVESVFNFG